MNMTPETSSVSDAEVLLASCRYPAAMLDATPKDRDKIVAGPAGRGQIAAGPADRGVNRLIQAWRPQSPDSCVITTGDQIYIDATAGIFDPVTAVPDRFDRASFGRALSVAYDTLKTKFVGNAESLIDDHAVLENWEPGFHAARNVALGARMHAGRDAFVAALRPKHNPGQPLWYTKTFVGHSMFLGDTRTERTPRDPRRLTAARIMSATQSSHLLAWLRQAPRDRFKLIATPAMLLPRRLTTADHPLGAMVSDAWDGFPGSMHELLAWIADHSVENCVFLSGDEHLPCIAKASVANKAGGPWIDLLSIHAGALYAPFPFANAQADDFSDEEGFCFDHAGQKYRCRVETWFPVAAGGDGFMQVKLSTSSDGVALQATFCAADGSDHRWMGTFP